MTGLKRLAQQGVQQQVTLAAISRLFNFTLLDEVSLSRECLHSNCLVRNNFQKWQRQSGFEPIERLVSNADGP